MNGTHLGVCVDRFYYGSCCKLPELQHEVDLGGGDTNDLTQVVKKPVTAANVAETSTTAAPAPTKASTVKPTTTTRKPPTTTAKPTTAASKRRQATTILPRKPANATRPNEQPPTCQTAKTNPSHDGQQRSVHRGARLRSPPWRPWRGRRTRCPAPRSRQLAANHPPTFPLTGKPTPSAKPTPPTFPKPASTQKPTSPTKPALTSTAKPTVTTAKPANVTDENWVQVALSTTSPASVGTKPTPTYPDGSLFTEEIPPSVSRPTPPTFPPKPSTLAPTTFAPEVTDAPLNMSDYKQVCGRRLYPDARIVGGTRSTFAKWPWQISLRQWRTSTYLHKCGAALLNENWAITAAHCVENVPPSDLLLRLGEHDLSTEKEAHPHLDRRVQIVASHPQFDSRTFEYDLALLRFYEPVTFQPNVIPICIPTDDKTYIGETAFVTGWGRLYEDGPLPSVMQEVSVPVLENAVCETMYRSAGYIEHIPNIFICAGWKKGGFDSCEGDSGGPMVIQREDKRWTLAGVISWGIGCAEPNQPGVYTRISHFKDWISQILQF
ncbi:Hypothetical predicted protein [Cloeon dipterum]|uniref:Peptidase S1 domain-containing protein n=1 Tax=Cloeon dipterum TaxID=197152 RepID=A0A8S1DKA6_9INSE|nr:Hypothetical predicted protein [Cloeon dipterum]